MGAAQATEFDCRQAWDLISARLFTMGCRHEDLTEKTQVALELAWDYWRRAADKGINLRTDQVTWYACSAAQVGQRSIVSAARADAVKHGGKVMAVDMRRNVPDHAFLLGISQDSRDCAHDPAEVCATALDWRQFYATELTARQRAVVDRLAQGMKKCDIANALSVSNSTISQEITAIWQAYSSFCARD